MAVVRGGGRGLAPGAHFFFFSPAGFPLVSVRPCALVVHVLATPGKGRNVAVNRDTDATLYAMNNIDYIEYIGDGDMAAAAAFEMRVQAWTSDICDAFARGTPGDRLQVRAERDDDYDLFEAVAARLFDECGVLAVHAANRSPLIFEVGPRAVDIWGPTIASVLDAAEADPTGALLDTYEVYEQTATTWRNLLRLQPLSMTTYEEALMLRIIEDMALARGLVVTPVDDHRFRVHLPRVNPVDLDIADLEALPQYRTDDSANEAMINDGADMSWWRSVFA
nr:hypothetical protein [Pandoravirus massiliensis]